MTAKNFATRARKSKTELNQETLDFLQSLTFVSKAQSKLGVPYQTHCVIKNGILSAFDGVITIGVACKFDFEACPHTMSLIDAIKNCASDVSITQLNNCVLSIKSGKFKASIQCHPSDNMICIAPDPKIATIDNRILDAFNAVVNIVSETAAKECLAGVLLQCNSVLATNGALVVEYWHGINLPSGLLLPKKFVKSVIDSDKNLTGFGYSPNSVTFYFEDDSFIRTNLYQSPFPQTDPIFNGCLGEPLPLPEEFFKAVSSIGKFTEFGKVYFVEDKVSSTKTPSLGASYEVECLPNGMAFNANYIKLIENYCESAHFDTNGHTMYFFSSKVRGALKGMVE